MAWWSEGDVELVRFCAAAIAAALKCPVARSVGSGVSEPGCIAEERKGAGVVRWVNGWYISGRSSLGNSLVGYADADV